MKSPRCSLIGSGERQVLAVATSASRSDAVEVRDHAGHATANVVRHVEQVVKGPVEVVGQEPDLLPEAVGPDRRYSPGAPPPTSTVTVTLQFGQVTSARVVPSVLIRR